MSATRRQNDKNESCAIPTEKVGVFVMRYNKGFRREVIKVANRCYWCGRQIYLKKGYLNTATIDHLYSRNDARRRGSPRLCVLACDECNQARGSLESEIMQGEASLLVV